MENRRGAELFHSCKNIYKNHLPANCNNFDCVKYQNCIRTCTTTTGKLARINCGGCNGGFKNIRNHCLNLSCE